MKTMSFEANLGKLFDRQMKQLHRTIEKVDPVKVKTMAAAERTQRLESRKQQAAEFRHEVAMIQSVIDEYFDHGLHTQLNGDNIVALELRLNLIEDRLAFLGVPA